MAGLTRGMLVEILGLPEPAKPVPEAGDRAPADLNGQKAQLVRFDREAKKWLAMTFSGDVVAVDPQFVRPMGGKELAQYDFVFGPASDFGTVGAELAGLLATKGYAVMRLLVAEEDAADMLTAARRLEEDGQFSRLAVEFERGYLGKDSTAKTLLLDPASEEAPDYVRSSAFRTMESNFGAISTMLGPYTREFLGFGLYSRTNMLLRMPLGENDEERYPTADIDDGDAEAYMHTMSRKRLTLLQFVGPGSGLLTLHPLGMGQPVHLRGQPHTLLFVVANRFDYSYSTEGESLTLTTFFMDEPAVFVITGHMEASESAPEEWLGPPPPKEEQCQVQSLYCRYGGNAEGRQSFWNSLQGAVDGVTAVPLERWDHSAYYDPEMQFPGVSSYTKHGCFGVDGVELFDCKFFDIPPFEARTIDPCQRQVMEVSYMALLEGGWDKKALQRKAANIGHFVGIDKDDWMCMGAAGMLDLSGAMGAAAASNSIISNRFNYTLNLKGASMSIDTACSSALVSTHVAKLHLRFREGEKMEAAVVNGLNLMLFHLPFANLCISGMLSREGRSMTFNATADGQARGESCGAACIRDRPYAREEAILASVAGSQANQDGRSANLTAPNGPAQEKLINAVLRECALTPTEVDCLESNGAGTNLGDPIELSAFMKIMGTTPRASPIVISCCKSNIAHSEGGSGFCGLAKVVMQVGACLGGGTVHFALLNPHVDIHGAKAHLPMETTPLREGSAYAGVSSFGYGGTNAHAEAWGKNILNSRGAVSRDPAAVFGKKLARAPPAEITMNGDDVSCWETTGMDPRAERGSRWRVYIDEDGVAEWETDDVIPDYGDEFFIRGTHTDWMPEELCRHDSIAGLWTGIVTLGESGEEYFQIMADSDPEKIFHPGQVGCVCKAARVFGPDAAPNELTWMVHGQPGQSFDVEFYLHGERLSVTWMKRF